MKGAAANTPLLTVCCFFCYMCAVTAFIYQTLDGLSQKQIAFKFICQVATCQQFDRPLISPSCPSLSKFHAIPVPLLIPLDFYVFPSAPFRSLFLSSDQIHLLPQHPPLMPLSGRELLSFLIKSEEGL